MSFHERLKSERLRMQLSQEKFAQLAGVSNRSQANYESGDRKPQIDYLEALTDAGVDTLYLMTGRKEKEEAAQVATQAGFEEMSMQEDGMFAPIPLYDIEAAAGAGSSLEREEIEAALYLPLAELSARRLDPANMVGVRVSGDSMEPTLTGGDWVLVDRSDCPERPEGVYLLLIHGERRIKRVQRVAGGGWFLISDNDLYQAELIKPQDKPNVQILGRCVMKIGEIS